MVVWKKRFRWMLHSCNRSGEIKYPRCALCVEFEEVNTFTNEARGNRCSKFNSKSWGQHADSVAHKRAAAKHELAVAKAAAETSGTSMQTLFSAQYRRLRPGRLALTEVAYSMSCMSTVATTALEPVLGMINRAMDWLEVAATRRVQKKILRYCATRWLSRHNAIARR
jgi:hypothetical protein